MSRLILSWIPAALIAATLFFLGRIVAYHSQLQIQQHHSGIPVSLRYQNQNQNDYNDNNDNESHSEIELHAVADAETDAATVTDDNDIQQTNITSESSGNLTTVVNATLGREPLVEIFHDAGVMEVDLALLLQLPLWTTVQKLYGKGPLIYGLDQCQAFREATPPEKRRVGPAGLFNTGTNLVSLYLEANCYFPQHANAIQWQVPWGKHVMASLRTKHVVTNKHEHDTTLNISTVLPIVTIRDPFYWMQSMCRQPYGLKWHHRPQHCPNLVPNEYDYTLYPFPGKNIPVRIALGKEQTTKWNSMAHLWSDWNLQYFHATEFPKLMVRFEDLIFYPKQVMTQVCECAGGTIGKKKKHKFLYNLDSAKFGPGHGTTKTTLASAMIRYGQDEGRRKKGLTPEDIALAKDTLDPELMHFFHYNQ